VQSRSRQCLLAFRLSRFRTEAVFPRVHIWRRCSGFRKLKFVTRKKLFLSHLSIGAKRCWEEVMRQLNIATRSANIIASVRDIAFVAGNSARVLRLHLLQALLGTWHLCQAYERPMMRVLGMRQMELVPAPVLLTPVTGVITTESSFSKSSQSISKRGS
jgi:hypothetical protein